MYVCVINTNQKKGILCISVVCVKLLLVEEELVEKTKPFYVLVLLSFSAKDVVDD